MKPLRFALAALAFVPAMASAFTVEFVNQSSWDIYEVYFSPANEKNWGEDHLGEEVLEKGDSLTLEGVSKGKWDVLVIDEDGDKCEVTGVALTGPDRWVITDEDLLGCQANS